MTFRTSLRQPVTCSSSNFPLPASCMKLNENTVSAEMSATKSLLIGNRTMCLTVIKASRLPQSYHVKSPSCYAAISVDGALVTQTECRTGTNPEWNDAHFDLDVQESSIIKLAIFRRSKPPFSKPQVIMIGEVLLPSADLPNKTLDTVENIYELQKHGTSKSGKYGSLVVRLQLIKFESEAIQESGPSTGDRELTASSNDQPAARPSDEAKLPLEDQVAGLFNEADRSAAKLSNAKGMSVIEDTTDTVDTGITMGDSDGFALVCGYVEKLMEIGDVVSQIHPWANLAWSILSVIPKTLIAQVRRDSKVQCLWDTAADMLGFLKDAKPVLDDILASIVSDMMKQIYHCAIFVREYGGEGFFKRTTQEILKSGDDIIAQYTNAFAQLKERFEARSRLATLKVLRDVSQGVVQLSNILDDLRDMEQIKTLETLRGPDLEGVRCNKYAVCLPATRKALLGGIMKWVTEPDGKRTLWLNGVAGSGKSTVANTIASLFAEMGLLGASFRFSQHIEPKYLFRNLAYQLALFDTRFRECLLRAFKTHGAMNSYSLREQLEKFVVEPMNAVLFVGPVVMVIDALDECGVESERREVLEAMAKEFPKLPSFIKILLTSRNERDIRAQLTTTSFPKSIHDTEGIADDILTYIDNRLHDVINSHPHLETTWPGIEGKKNLGSRADGLFIWVTVASEYIKASPDPDRALNDVLRGKATNAQRGPEASLDILYLGILQRTPMLLYSIEATKYVVGAILVAKMPLTQIGLDSLLGLGKNVARPLRDGSQVELTSSASLINALGSIFRVDDMGVVRVLHASVADFFTNPHRCTDERFFIDRSKYDCELAICCFKTMNGLTRDICAVNNPTKLNSEIPDLHERLHKYLTEDLQYACCFWHRHLQDIQDGGNDVYNGAKAFLFSHLLHWIEVMSLLDDINGVFLALKDIKTWLQSITQNNPNYEVDVNQLVDESLHLMQRFHEPIQLSAAHVYVSAIPLTPSTSVIFKVYAPKLMNIPILVQGDATSPPWTDICPHPDWEWTAISFSLDRSWLIYPSANKLEIWDVVRCYPLRAPLAGHGARIHCIKFSQDGTKFCSADADNCVIVWDATTFDAIGVPIQLPYFANKIGLWADRVVACDGGCRVSLWDIDAGTLVADHKLRFVSDLFVGMSLQGAYLVIRKPEKITNIWYTITGEDVIDKFTHGREITDVMFSPDNTKVACVYHSDSCAYMLDVPSGDVVGDPIDMDVAYFRHTRLGFSPSGKRFVAVKNDGVNVYDIDNGKLVYGRERKHIVQGAELALEEARLLVWDSSSFEVLDIPSGNVVGSSKVHSIPYRNTISPNGNHVILCSRHAITVFDVLSLSSRDNISIASVTPSPSSSQPLFALSNGTLCLAMDIYSTCPVELDGARSPAAFSPEGSTLASAYKDHTLRLWNVKDAKAIGKPLRGHRKAVTAIAFSPTGSRLVSASDDNTIRIWSATSGGEELLRLHAYSDIRSISWSSDESRFVCVSERGIIHTLNASTGFVIRQPSLSEWYWAEFLPGGNEIVCLSVDGQSRLLGCQTGLITEHPKLLSGRQITEVVFSPNRTYFISISTTDLINFSDITASSGSSFGAACHPARWLTFSSHGKCMMSVVLDPYSQYLICMWDSQSGRLMWEDLCDCHDAPSVAISHSGNMAVVWSTSVCLVRDASVGTIISRWNTNSAVQFVSFSPDEGQIVCIPEGSNILEHWDINCGTMVDSSKVTGDSRSAVPSGPGASGKTLLRNTLGSDYQPTVHTSKDTVASAVSPDGTQLAVAHRRWILTFCDVKNGTEKVVFEILDSPMRLPKFSSDGSKVAAVVKDTLIHVWDTATGHLLGQFQKDGAFIQSLALSPDGTQIISICGRFSEPNRIVQMWHVGDDSGVSIDTYEDPPMSAAFFPDGAQFITTSQSGAIRIWDLTSTILSSVVVSTLSSFSWANNISISSDGTRLISRDCLWDIINCQVLKSFEAFAAKFSPDGTRVALAYNSHVQILDAASGATLHRSDFIVVSGMSFSLDSTQLLVRTFDGIVHVLDLTCLPNSVNTKVLSCAHPPDFMMIQSTQHGGWYRGTNGARLIWLPQDMQPVWLATGGEQFEPKRLILGSTNGLSILDMDDYLEVPLVGAAWRKGGVRYIHDLATANQASVLMCESGSANIPFILPYIAPKDY